MGKKVALHNLGCKVNAYELEAVEQLLEARGYEIVPFEPGADIYIINTCTVTNIADRKSRQMLHRAKKMNPQALVAAVGCYAQARGGELERDPAIDLVIGNNRKKEIPDLLEACLRERRKHREVPDIGRERDYEPLRIAGTKEHTRAFLKVQDGCNQFCSYCIIPYTRGRVRSRDPQEVLREVQRLSVSGCREIVLSGIHLSSYGADFENGTGLLELIRLLHPVEGIARIRLGSLEPGIITERFAEQLSRLPKVCPHFHLSLQSGCDRTLRRMNRRYTSGEYLEKCRILRKYFKDPALTTDIITGFPGETEEDFRRSREFVEKVSFFETHVFPYSRREGTKAAKMEEQIPEAVKKERSHVLLELNRRQKEKYLKAALGRETEVLLEEREEFEGRPAWSGYTREYRKVLVLSEKDLGNTLLTVCPEKVCRGEFLLCT
ncbi:MAG TPA: tRNA (N(6)-L-threonylcarbamoyladenosine(37)-C(2))-methylthiotransferase MtaB [Candidatus Scatomonas merdigallinarum]|nr:tRNA (N(6)-L-threonylcarbamoyladenosine(37)-C(2))-methylthiotransferase MtaB [Candidatus Scatomonas merdigallinarum]